MRCLPKFLTKTILNVIPVNVRGSCPEVARVSVCPYQFLHQSCLLRGRRHLDQVRPCSQTLAGRGGTSPAERLLLHENKNQFYSQQLITWMSHGLTSFQMQPSSASRVQPSSGQADPSPARATGIGSHSQDRKRNHCIIRPRTGDCTTYSRTLIRLRVEYDCHCGTREMMLTH